MVIWPYVPVKVAPAANSTFDSCSLPARKDVIESVWLSGSVSFASKFVCVGVATVDPASTLAV